MNNEPTVGRCVNPNIRSCLPLLVLSLAICGATEARRASAQSSGVIVTNDEAPPPTDAEKQTAKIYGMRSGVLAQGVQRLATAMKATQALRAALGSPAAGVGAGGDLAAPMVAWKANWTAMISPRTAGGSTTLQPDAIPAYVAASLQLAAAAAAAPPAQRPAALAADVQQAFDLQSLVLDDMIAEHAVLNRDLRFYPYNVVPQTPLGCPLVNQYSRDFRCLATAEMAAPQTASWMFHAPFMRSDYCVATQGESFAKEQSEALTMLVRKALFDDHVLASGTAGAVVKSPHDRATLLPQC